MEAHLKEVRELNELQRSHLAWRLDQKTVCGYVSACRIARGTYGWAGGKLSIDITLFEIFKAMDLTDRSAKIQSKKVVEFNNSTRLIKPGGAMAKTEK